jgi:mannose-6-phosphate isomerase-like protein (cupin superfamily)
MLRTALRIAVAACAVMPTLVVAQVQNNGPKAATYITDEDVTAVNALPGIDRQIVSVDVGKTNVQVGIIHRVAAPAGGAARGGAGAAGGTGAAAGRGAGAGGGAAAAAQSCGEQATTPPTDAAPGGISHDGQTETYYIVSGTGTLVTGGHIVNGRKSPPESEVTKVLNGPSCSGMIAGADVVRRKVKTGDIIIIPAGVPHGWIDIIDHVDYLSVRPDPERVLAAGYVNPALQKK